MGFNVILFDSKHYPLLKNEDSSSPDFWKSTCKIIAALVKVYEKSDGVSEDADVFKNMEMCDDPDSSEPPKKKPCKKGRERRNLIKKTS